MAIAVPLGLPNREVFLSYNFEANYNSPAAPDYAHLGLADLEKVKSSFNTWWLPTKLEPIFSQYNYPYDGGRSGDGNNQTLIAEVPKKKPKQKAKENRNKEKSKKISKRIRRFVDRNIVFNVIENKLISYGFSKACLLRAICEVATVEYGYHNGVFGDIFHILFT